MYRKPTTIDIINNNSVHPDEHKMTSFKSWIYRLNKLYLNGTTKHKELNIIITILKDNGFKKEQITILYNETIKNYLKQK
jgi:hypothetical protein